MCQHCWPWGHAELERVLLPFYTLGITPLIAFCLLFAIESVWVSFVLVLLSGGFHLTVQAQPCRGTCGRVLHASDPVGFCSPPTLSPESGSSEPTPIPPCKHLCALRPTWMSGPFIILPTPGCRKQCGGSYCVGIFITILPGFWIFSVKSHPFQFLSQSPN